MQDEYSSNIAVFQYVTPELLQSEVNAWRLTTENAMNSKVIVEQMTQTETDKHLTLILLYKLVPLDKI